MRILHTADWHLGKRLNHLPRLEEQREVMEEICAIADREQVDVVIIAGDLYDQFNPPTEAVELFYKTVKRLANDGKRAVVAIAGNHDSPDRIEAPEPLARECGILLVGYPHSVIPPFELDTGLKVLQSQAGFVELQLPGQDVPLRLILTPYANEYRLKTFLDIEDKEAALREVLQQRWKDLSDKFMDDKGVNLLVTHLFLMKEGSEPPEEPEDEKPILHVGGAQAVYSKQIPKAVQYVALGHLHRKQTVDEKPCPVVYSSSPLSYSFSEAGQEKYVILVDIEPGKPAKYEALPLTAGKPLLRGRFESTAEAVEWLIQNPDTLVELTIVTDQFLTSADRKELENVHKGIVAIIPEIKDPKRLERHKSLEVDLQKDIKELFTEYFQFKTGQEPGEEMMDLFKEVLSVQDDENNV